MAKRKVNKGEKIPKDCLDAASKALNLFSEEELHEYVLEVNEKAQEFEDLIGAEKLKKAQEEVNKTTMDFLFEKATIKAKNVNKYQHNVNEMKAGTDLAQLSPKIETAQRSARQELYQQTFGKMTKEQEELFSSGKIDDEIMAHNDGVESEHQDVRVIANLVKDYTEKLRNLNLIQSGAYLPSEILEDRILRNYYDPSRVASAGQSLITRALSRGKVDSRAPKDIFIEDMKAELNMKRTFGKTKAMQLNGEVNPAEVDRMLGNSFENIIRGKNDIFTKTVVAADREVIERSKRRFYHFKDWRSWGRINKKYGKGTLHEALLGDIQSSGNQIGLARIMGSSPQTMFNDLRHAQEEFSPLSRPRYMYADGLFKQVAQINQSASWPALANISASIRQLSSMARLGMITLQSLSDVSQAAGIAQRFGFGFWKNYVDSIVHTFNLIPEKDRIRVAQALKMNVDVHMGYMGRYVDATHMGQLMNKLSNTFYWVNALNAFDKGNKLSGITFIARGFGKSSHKTFAALNEQTQKQLNKFRLAPHEWDGLRAKTKDGLFLPDNVDSLSESELRAIWEKGEKDIAFSDYRHDLYRKVFGMLDTASENAVLDPRAFERMISTYNLPAGSAGGEAMRMVMQFKSYPAAYFKRVWMGGLSDFDSVQGKLMYAFNMASTTMMMGYLSKVLVGLTKGYSPPDPSEMNYQEKLKYFIDLIAPGAGIFGRVLDPQNQNKHLLINLLLTPSVSMMSDPLAAAFATVTGNFKGAKKDVLDFAKYANPIGTLPISEPFFESLMGNKPFLEPGQKPLW